MLQLRRWLILVFLNAPASFTAAWFTEHDTFLDIVEMILGILTFVMVALAVDAWISSRGLLNLRDALVKATKIKIGLQLIPAVEFVAGVIAAGIMTALFHWDPLGSKHLGQTYLMTLITGAVLTVVVFLLAGILLYFRSRRNAQGV